MLLMLTLIAKRNFIVRDASDRSLWFVKYVQDTAMGLREWVVLCSVARLTPFEAIS